MKSIKRLKYHVVTFFLLLCSTLAFAQDMTEHAIVERIAPIGEINILRDKGDDQTQVAATTAPAKPRTAESIYKTFCTVCHTAGIAGSPKLGDKAAWDARLAKGRDMLNNHAINGFNAMPARGTCMNCSDEEIISTIDYMIAQ